MQVWLPTILLAQNAEQLPPETNYFAYGMIGAAIGTVVIVAAMILQLRKNKQDEQKQDTPIGRRRR